MKILPFLRIFLLFVFLLVAVNTSNTKSVKNLPKERFFEVSKKPPSGFEALEVLQVLMVNVYFHGQYLGVVQAEVTPFHLRFLDPKDVVSLLGKNLVHPNIVEKVLSKKLPVNGKLLCKNKRAVNCNILRPKIAGIIYDSNTANAYIFVNSDYLKEASKSLLNSIGPSSAGFSYVNKFNVISSNTALKSSYNNFNISSNSALAYKNTRLNFLTSYTHTLGAEISAQISNYNLVRVENNHQYSVGMLSTYGNIFFSDVNYLGAEFRTILDTVPGALNGVSLPIDLFLDFPSRIEVYKDDSLIYSGSYKAGNQLLNTSQFPTGAYSIVIKIISNQGTISTQERYFVKTPLLVPKDMPQYYASFGYLKDSQELGQLFSRLKNIPVYAAGTNIRLANNIGMNFSFLGAKGNLLSTLGWVYMKGNWIIQPAVLLGLDSRIGYSGAVTYRNNNISIYTRITQIKHKRDASFYDDDNSIDSYSNILNSNALQVLANVGYHFGESNISFFGSYNKKYLSESEYSYGTNFNTTLLRSSGFALRLGVSANKSKGSYSVLSTLSASFSSGKTVGNAYATYNPVTNRLNANGFANWNYVDSSNSGYKFGLGADINNDTQGLGGDYTYQNNKVRINAFGDYNHLSSSGTGSKSFVQYGGSLSTHFVYTPEIGMAFSAGRTGNTGVFVKVKNSDLNENGSFDVYVNGVLSKKVKSNEKVLISLNPFKVYEISVVNNSSSLFRFSRPERHVTIYPGNIQSIVWVAQKEVIVAGRLLDKNKKPVKYALISGGIGYNATDKNGYFQLSKDINMNQFKAKNGNKVCRFKISSTALRKNFAYVGDVVCMEKRQNENSK